MDERRRLVMSLSKKMIGLIVATVLIVGGVVWYFAARGPEGPLFRMAEVKKGSLTATISATGTVEPMETVDVGAQVAGQIVKFGMDAAGKPVDYGSHVKEGEMLAQIDDVPYQLDIATAKAQLEQAKASQARAEADL